jgi:hypothetical protein
VIRGAIHKYTECFIDEGQVNMFAVMQELIKHGYSRTMWAEHPHILITIGIIRVVALVVVLLAAVAVADMLLNVLMQDFAGR